MEVRKKNYFYLNALKIIGNWWKPQGTNRGMECASQSSVSFRILLAVQCLQFQTANKWHGFKCIKNKFQIHDMKKLIYETKYHLQNSVILILCSPCLALYHQWWGFKHIRFIKTTALICKSLHKSFAEKSTKMGTLHFWREKFSHKWPQKYQRKTLHKIYSCKITENSYLPQNTNIFITLSLCRKKENKDMFPVVKSWIKQEKARKK